MEILYNNIIKLRRYCIVYIFRLKKDNYSTIKLRSMTLEDINKFNDIKKRKDIEIYKIAAFAMISSIVLVIVMVHLYNLNLQ